MRYTSGDEDSARWQGFAFRPGDIVISTRSKHGTTWMQMICALLIFGTPDLPEPLARLSPWLDWLTAPREEVFARLDAQRHRRFIKTHTPLDGIPLDPMATYLVVGRHPLDGAVSLYHQGANIDRDRLRQLTGRDGPEPGRPPRPPLREWLLSWIDSDVQPQDSLDSLPGVMWHLSDAWSRRNPAGGDRPKVLLFHYDELSADLGGQMRRLAELLDITIPPVMWPSLVRAATFGEMRAAAAAQLPHPAGVLKDPLAFFRRGRPGAGREALSEGERARYHARARTLAEPDMLGWLHHGVPAWVESAE